MRRGLAGPEARSPLRRRLATAAGIAAALMVILTVSLVHLAPPRQTTRKESPEKAVPTTKAGGPLTEEEMRAALAARYRRDLEKSRTLIRAAVIIDLSAGEGDALQLAIGWAGALGHQANVALWDPQQGGR